MPLVPHSLDAHRPADRLRQQRRIDPGVVAAVGARARDPDPVHRALSLNEQAIQRDPRYGPALAWAALCYARLCADGLSEDPEADSRKSVDFARRALQVGADDPDVLAPSSRLL